MVVDPGPPVSLLSAAWIVVATGAGDAHITAILARLTSGHDFLTAAFKANVAASLSLERPGPATGPTASELAQAIANS